MIIATYARTGSTKFGLDLAEKHNLKFMGEIEGSYLISSGCDNRKIETHETNFQPMLTDKEYYNAIYNHKDMVVLINRGGYLVLDKADYVVLRDDPLGCCLSFADLLMRPTKGDPLHWRNVLLYTRLMFADMISLVTCVVEYPTDLPIVWFEDLYPNHTQNLKYITHESIYEIAKGFFTEFIEASDVQDKLDILKTKKIVQPEHPGKSFSKHWSFAY